MDWIIFLSDLIRFAIITGAISYIIKYYFDKKFEEFKNRMEQEKIRFSKLHEKRGEVICKLYGLLDDLDKTMGILTSPAEFTGDLPRKEKIQNAAESGDRFVEYYSKNAIYFREDIEILLNELKSNFRKSFIIYNLSPHHGEKEWDEKIKAWEIIIDKIPPLKKKLKDEFRRILGVHTKIRLKK